ncbi:MAG: LD-carboxypeptidase [Aristaeellaceae bacterium]
MRRRFSAPLLPGMTIGLTAPASPIFEPDRRDAAVRLLEGMGFRVLRGATVDAVDFCFAGNHALRARDLQDMFLNDSVDAVVCLRGGYGSARLLPLLDFGAIARHPKPFVGFSDITALHAALHRYCGFVTFHGPMPGVMDAIGLRESRARQQWLDVLSGAAARQVANPDGEPLAASGHGTVTGRLIGGNLNVLSSLMGTPWEPEWDGKLLLLEDVAERADRLDAMMSQLKAAGVFERVKGLVIGDFSRYEGMTTPRKLPLDRIIAEAVPAELPIIYRLHAGHGRDRMTLALNACYRLNPRTATLTMVEDVFRTARRG